MNYPYLTFLHNDKAGYYLLLDINKPYNISTPMDNMTKVEGYIKRPHKKFCEDITWASLSTEELEKEIEIIKFNNSFDEHLK